MRISDRVESVVTLLAALLVTLCIPVAATMGTAVHDQLVIRDAEYAASLQQVPATVTGMVIPHRNQPYDFAYSTPVQWTFDHVNRRGNVERPTRSQIGDQLTVWVDDRGALSRGPAVEGRAARDAITVAMVAWAAMAAAVVSVVWLVRWRLDVGRYEQWARGLERLAEDGSRH